MNIKRIETEDELKEAFAIRKEVFIDEQGTPDDEEYDAFDNLEADCTHILIYQDGKAVGTGRIRTVEGTGKLERICIREPFRKGGVGRHIIQELEDIASEQGLSRVKLHGQTHAEGFYHKLGYVSEPEIFYEAGIPHKLMKKELKG